MKLYNENCYDVLKTIESNSVDLILTDPPYNIGYCEFDKEVLDWDLLRKEFKRILKPNGSLVVFQGWSNVCETKEILEKEFYLKDWIIYDRIKGRGAKKNLVSTREDILWFVNDKEKYTFNKLSSNILKKTGGLGIKNGCKYRALSNVWTDISPIVPWSKERVAHPTQKPVQLMDRCVKLWSNEDDVVLDPFMGSGSTGVSSLHNNRHFIGIEINKEYFEIAKKRILNELETSRAVIRTNGNMSNIERQFNKKE